MNRRIALLISALVVMATAWVAAPGVKSAGFAAHVDFGPSGAALPSGYMADFGQAFDAGRGFGWVAQSSSTPLSLVGNGRDRNKVADQRLDTLMHMQYTASSGGVATPGRWEHVLPAGIYDVTVAVGDASYFNSVHRLTVEGTLAVNNFVGSADYLFQTATVRVNVADGRLTIDAAGGTNTKVLYVDIAEVDGPPPPPPPASSLKVDFGPAGAALPSGYVADFGQAFDAGRGYGWVAQGSSTPLSLVGNGRDRNKVADQRLDTLMHMQFTGSSGGVAAPGRWEHALAAGTYDVTVAVGDASYFNSVHRLTVEGTLAVNNFAPSASTPFKTVTVQVAVADGRLTVDAAGGTNTKIDYVDIAEADGPPPPPPPPPGQPPAFTWTAAPSAPDNRNEAAGAAVDGKLYVFGGYPDRTFRPITRSDVFDATTGTWSPLAPMPRPLTHVATAVDGHSIYFAGGYAGNPDGSQTWAITDVYRYNIDTNTWTSLAPLPAARGSGGLVRLGRKLHFFGGNDINQADKGDHWVLDLDAPTAWTPAVALPNGRSHLGAVAHQGKIFAIGGQHGYSSQSVVQTSVHVWDPASPNAWTAAASLPAGRSHMVQATFEFNGWLIIAGGETSPAHPSSAVLYYDAASNSWKTTTPLPAARHSGVAGVLNGAVYYATGYLPTGNFTNTVYKGQPN